MHVVDAISQLKLSVLCPNTGIYNVHVAHGKSFLIFQVSSMVLTITRYMPML